MEFPVQFRTRFRKTAHSNTTNDNKKILTIYQQIHSNFKKYPINERMEAVHLFIVSFQDGNSLAIKGNSASESGVCCRLVSNAATSPSLPLSLSLSLSEKRAPFINLTIISSGYFRDCLERQVVK